jgi:hypothetical protein
MKGGFELMAFFLVQPFGGGEDFGAARCADYFALACVNRNHAHITNHTGAGAGQLNRHHPEVGCGQRKTVRAAANECRGVMKQAVFISHATRLRLAYCPQVSIFWFDAHRLLHEAFFAGLILSACELFSFILFRRQLTCKAWNSHEGLVPDRF